MNNWHKGRKVSVISDKPLTDYERIAWKICYYEGDDVGYMENDVTVGFGKDGSLHIRGDDHSVFLYPAQVKKLRGLLRNIRQPPIPTFKQRKIGTKNRDD